MFARTIDLLGPDRFALLRQAFVVVAGLGGVGSHAAVALARAGVGRLRLVDADTVTASSLNRHAVAGQADVGRAKTEVLQDHLRRIRGNELEVTAARLFLDEETVDEVLDGSPDLVIDAIDSLGPKTTLLVRCSERQLPVIASMGASSRTDATAVRVGDLYDTDRCPLARHLRRRLRRCGVPRGITAVFSTEPPRPPLPPDDNEEGAVRRGRQRHRQPSLSTLPGIFGYALANLAILRLTGLELQP